jgi:hypothetical protein
MPDWLQVSKPVPGMEAFSNLCNSLVPDSYNDEEREVRFSRLDKLKAHTVGVFGYREDVWQVLKEHGAQPGQRCWRTCV